MHSGGFVLDTDKHYKRLSLSPNSHNSIDSPEKEMLIRVGAPDSVPGSRTWNVQNRKFKNPLFAML